ncbi:MAG: PilN domain-containing protein [Candidatus Nomurabacteria bacterium]|nr:PilN domain-containing protein [Candidatus Nomurabacteria bacterium]
MINLLPLEEKKRIVKEYYFRLFIFSLYTVGICFIVAGVSLLPSFFLVSLKENILTKKWETLQAMPVSQPDKETMDAISDVNKKIDLITKTEKEKFLVLENAFNQVIFQKMPDIKLTEIAYDKKIEGTRSINIKGFALNRERLLLFRQSLENNPAFSKVDLPISNFVKEKNISFNLNLTSI